MDDQNQTPPADDGVMPPVGGDDSAAPVEETPSFTPPAEDAGEETPVETEEAAPVAEEVPAEEVSVDGDSDDVAPAAEEAPAEGDDDGDSESTDASGDSSSF